MCEFSSFIDLAEADGCDLKLKFDSSSDASNSGMAVSSLLYRDTNRLVWYSFLALPCFGVLFLYSELNDCNYTDKN